MKRASSFLTWLLTLAIFGSVYFNADATMVVQAGKVARGSSSTSSSSGGGSATMPLGIPDFPWDFLEAIPC